MKITNFVKIFIILVIKITSKPRLLLKETEKQIKNSSKSSLELNKIEIDENLLSSGEKLYETTLNVLENQKNENHCQ